MTPTQPPDTRPCAVEGCPRPSEPLNAIHAAAAKCPMYGAGCLDSRHHAYVPTLDPRDELIARVREAVRDFDSDDEGALYARLLRISGLIEKYE